MAFVRSRQPPPDGDDATTQNGQNRKTAIRIQTVTWHLPSGSAVPRVTAIATEQALSDEAIRAEIARRCGLAVPEAIAIDAVVVS